MFERMINDFAAESGLPLSRVAAALAHVAQQGRPFLMKDRPRKEREQEDGRSDDRKQRRNKGKRERKKPGPPAAGMKRYRIQVGWRDGVKPGNIVGAVANEAGIEGDCIGPIEINHGYTLIDLPEGMPGEVFRTLQRTWVAGRQLRISVDGERPPRRERSASRQGKRSEKPGARNSDGRPECKGKRKGGPGGKYSGKVAARATAPGKSDRKGKKLKKAKRR